MDLILPGREPEEDYEAQSALRTLIEADMTDSKKPYQSKTLWVNLLLAIASFFPQVKDNVTPDLLGSVFLVINTILRFTTKTPIVTKSY